MAQRENVRLDREVEVLINMYYDKSGQIVTLPEKVAINVINVSATGLLIRSDLEIEEGETFYFDLILDTTSIKVMPKVVRKMFDEEANMNLYGCSFVKLDSAEEYIIRKFIFENEIEKRVKDKGADIDVE